MSELVDRDGLENRRLLFGVRGFESLSLLAKKVLDSGIFFLLFLEWGMITNSIRFACNRFAYPSISQSARKIHCMKKHFILKMSSPCERKYPV